MNDLKITKPVYDALIDGLIAHRHLCFIGGNKCGKSRVAEVLIQRLESIYGQAARHRMKQIAGVHTGTKIVFPKLDKPLFFLKNISGMSIKVLEKLMREGYIISTFPIPSLGLIYNRFLAFDCDYNDIPNYDVRLWKCIPLIAKNRKLGDGNVYVMHVYTTSYGNGIVSKKSICHFVQNTSLSEGEFSRVSGKYSFEPG